MLGNRKFNSSNLDDSDSWLTAQQDQFADGPLANAAAGHGPGRGGGGGDDQGDGGKPGLLTTFTSGNPHVSDANEFNIQINFSGEWTMKQQAVVKWAADFYSHLITADIRDDIDLNGNPVDDIVINMSTGPIDGAGDPTTGVNILAQTVNLVVRD